jgi:hypothetical protein
MSACDSKNGVSADCAMSLRDGGRLFAPLAREIVVCSSASGLSPAATICSAYHATRRFPHIPREHIPCGGDCACVHDRIGLAS